MFQRDQTIYDKLHAPMAIFDGLSWFNWHLKGDMGPTGKGYFIGDTCTLCKDSGWEVASANIQ